MAGVPVDRPDPLAPEPPYRLEVELDHRGLQLVDPQQPREGLADGPMPDHDRPIVSRIIRQVRHGLRVPACFESWRLEEPPEEPPERPDEAIVDRVDRDRQDSGG